MSKGAVVLGLWLAAAAGGATRIDLNRDWRFRVDAEKSGEAAGWFRTQPEGTEAVSLPHTWNIG